MMTTKVAVIGAGYTAREHIRAFSDVPGTTVSGIHSRGRRRAELLASDFGIDCVCDSIAELAEKSEADLVVVTVPELEARGVATACFDYGWKVLLEKPAGYNFSDAQDIVEAASATSADVLVALNRRFLSATLSVKEELRPVPGKRFIKVQDQQDQGAARAAGQPEPIVRNWMYANSIHTIDYLSHMGRGAIADVENVVPWTPSSPFLVIAKIAFASGDVGLYEGVWGAPGPWAVTVTTDEQRWEMRPLEEATRQRRGERHGTQLEQHPWDRDFKPGFRRQAEEVVRHVRGEPSGVVSLADALETMRLISRIFSLHESESPGA